MKDFFTRLIINCPNKLEHGKKHCLSLSPPVLSPGHEHVKTFRVRNQPHRFFINTSLCAYKSHLLLLLLLLLALLPAPVSATSTYDYYDNMTPVDNGKSSDGEKMVMDKSRNGEMENGDSENGAGPP